MIACRRPQLLHVAALPFPTHQGTQAVIKEMLDVSAREERDAHLLTYAACGYALETAFQLHRAGDFPRYRSLRSGPSLRKALLDARMVADCRALSRRLQPDLIIAHHVEAAAISLAASQRPVVFYAHTDLGAELPSYPGVAALAPLGRDVDRFLSHRAAAVAAISPALRTRLQALCGPRVDVSYVPPPWPLSDRPTGQERREARERLRLPPDAPVLLYAGNLDHYQGWDLLLSAFAQVRQTHRGCILLVATESEPEPLLQTARAAGISEGVRLSGIGSEKARRRVHAAADIAAIPRRTPGGMPIKMLDALARGVPCALMPRATAGLALTTVAQVAQSDDTSAFAAAICDLLEHPAHRHRLAAASRRYVEQEHSARKFLTSLDELCLLALQGQQEKRLPGGVVAAAQDSTPGR